MGSHPQQIQERNVPIRNLASFLTEAFSGPGAVEQGQNVRQGQHIQDSTSSLQEGPTQQPNQQPGDMFTQMMHNLTGGAAVIMRNPQGQQQQLQTGAQVPQQQGTGTWATGTTRIIFGNPGNGMAFSPGSGGTAGGPGGVLPFLPFIMMGGGSEGMPDRMGDFVFSQGAMDNIITELMNQAAGRYGPQPAPEEMINELPKFTMTKELLASSTITDCAVCKDDFEEENEVMTLPCNHIFHVECIKPWLERSGTCPVCRHQLVEQPEPSRNTDMPAGMPIPLGGTAPVSPTQPRSPPIQGSSMPGGFPGGFPFNMFGMRGDTASDPSNNPTNPHASAPSNRPRDEPQGQPDFDMDLD